MIKVLPWGITGLAAVVGFGLVVTKVGTPQLVDSSTRLWMLLALAWVASIFLGIGTVRCFDGLFSPLDNSLPWYKLSALVVLETGLIGVLCILMAMSWGASQVGQLSYARHQPAGTLDQDIQRVGAAIQEDCAQKKTAPESGNELVRLILQSQVVLRYTWIRDGLWLDPWGRTMRYQLSSEAEEGSCDVVIYSLGPNGVDDNRGGDDIVFEFARPEPTDL